MLAGTNAAGRHAMWGSVPGFWTTIGDATVKYHAWGDGFERSRLVARDDGFTVWYERGGAVVGVLTHNADMTTTTSARNASSRASGPRYRCSDLPSDSEAVSAAAQCATLITGYRWPPRRGVADGARSLSD